MDLSRLFPILERDAGKVDLTRSTEAVLRARNMARLIIPDVDFLPPYQCPVLVDAHDLVAIRGVLMGLVNTADNLMTLVENLGHTE